MPGDKPFERFPFSVQRIQGARSCLYDMENCIICNSIVDAKCGCSKGRVKAEKIYRERNTRLAMAIQRASAKPRALFLPAHSSLIHLHSMWISPLRNMWLVHRPLRSGEVYGFGRTLAGAYLDFMYFWEIATRAE